MIKNIVLLLVVVLLSLSSVINCSDVQVFNDDGYGSDITVYETAKSTVISSENEVTSVCKPGWMKCVQSITVTENGFYGFRKTDSFISNDCRYLEFAMKVIPSAESTSTPLIQCSVETVATPKRVNLNSTTYVNTSGDENTINILDWSFVRIKMSDLNVNAPTFNSFQLWADQNGTTIIFGGASFVDAPTSLYPIGSVDNASSSSFNYSFVLILLILLITILI